MGRSQKVYAVPLESGNFYGPTYYSKIKHMKQDTLRYVEGWLKQSIADFFCLEWAQETFYSGIVFLFAAVKKLILSILSFRESMLRVRDVVLRTMTWMSIGRPNHDATNEMEMKVTQRLLGWHP